MISIPRAIIAILNCHCHFFNLASQKNYISVYHMGIYADPKVAEWAEKDFQKRSLTKIDMGKCCLRFKKIDEIPNDLVGKLAGKISLEQWIRYYVKSRRKKD